MSVKFWGFLFEVCITIGVMGALAIGIAIAMIKTVQWLERK